MRPSKSTIVLLMLAAGGYVGWTQVSRAADETVVLHIPPTTRSQDTYVNLWVVEDGRGLWIRAERPSRLWLSYLEGSPIVELIRVGDARRYRAVVDDTSQARAHVDPMFREKYGVADQVRAYLRSDTVPIRLERP